MPVKERLIIPVKAGVDDWKEQIKDLLQTLKKQEGNIRTRQSSPAPSTVYFVQFVPYAPKEVIDSPFIQVLTITGSESSEDTLQSAVESYKGTEGCNGVGSGLSLSEVDGKGQVFVGVIGWNTLEESEKGRAAKTLSVDGQTELHHVNFRFPIKGFRGL